MSINIAGIVRRLDDRLDLIRRRHELQNQIDELAKAQGEIDEKIRKLEYEIADAMKERRQERLSYKGAVYRIMPAQTTGVPDRIYPEKCLTLSESDRESLG